MMKRKIGEVLGSSQISKIAKILEMTMVWKCEEQKMLNECMTVSEHGEMKL
jgi:hypothetical protein